jgi:hypothetical protein
MNDAALMAVGYVLFVALAGLVIFGLMYIFDARCDFGSDLTTREWIDNRPTAEDPGRFDRFLEERARRKEST